MTGSIEVVEGARRAPSARAPRAERFEKRRRGARLSPQARESLAVFALALVGYGALGWHLVVRQHVIMFDAVARLSHAYFVWWNSPPKLTAVGFVWPPIATLVFLPLTVLKPIATSLLALPLTTAFFAGLLLVALNRTFRVAGMPAGLRYPLLAAFALNPMITFYATNGMSEIVYLFFLTSAVLLFVRWYLERSPTLLVGAGIYFAVGILSRYEVMTWAVVLSGAIVAALIRQHVSREELEGTVIAYLAPIAYGIGLWLFFNWLILKDPLFWLRHQAPGTVGSAPQGSALAHVSLTVAGPRPSARHVATELLDLNWHLFAPTILVLVGLALSVLWRRDLMALMLAVLITLNAAFSGLLIWFSHSEAYSQLRYNMRAMPLALIGIAWLYLRARSPRERSAVWVAALVALVLAAPLTWQTMRTFKQQYLEYSFTQAVSSWKSQEGTRTPFGSPVGIAADRGMAGYIKAHVHSRNAILTDDAQTFSIMLLSGHPDWFLDRIDKGDAYWLRVLASPYGRVRYVLFSQGPEDLVRLSYPGLQNDTQLGFHIVRADGPWRLAAIAPHAPVRRIGP